MSSNNSLSSIGSMFFGFWLMGGSFISLSAAMVFFKFQGSANLDAYLVYTILGGIFLVLGILCAGIAVAKNKNNSNATEMLKPFKILLIITILLDTILVVVANVA